VRSQSSVAVPAEPVLPFPAEADNIVAAAAAEGDNPTEGGTPAEVGTPAAAGSPPVRLSMGPRSPGSLEDSLVPCMEVEHLPLCAAK